jgi:hypothetical protein
MKVLGQCEGLCKSSYEHLQTCCRISELYSLLSGVDVIAV